MRAAFIDGKESVVIREVDTPAPPPGEVLVAVRVCGVCGSDLHFYDGSFPSMPGVSPGHEIAGEVAALGEGVSGFAVGDRVVVEALRSCRACEYCNSGRYHICPRHMMIGTQVTGGMADYISVPAYTLYRIPDGMDFSLAEIAEPLACCVHGLHLVDLKPGERVVVIGSGTMGLMTTLAASAAGCEVIATYRHDHQGEAALALGAGRVLRDSEIGMIDGADVVVETIGGHAPTLQQALGIVRPGGRVSVLGVFTQMQQVNALGLVLKDVRMAGGITYCRPGLHSDFDVALSILKAHGERARLLVTHTFPLDEAARAFATAADKSTKSLKVQVQP